MEQENTLLINQSTIKQLISTKEINDLVDKTFKGFADGNVINPSKVTLDLGETGNYPFYEGFMNAMPAYVGFQDIAGQKWVGGFQGERKAAGLPYITALIMLINPHLGTFLSVMDGAYISNMRTGAQAAIALEYLLHTDTVSIGMYGAGMQARTTIEAISERMDISQLIVWNHRRVTAEKFKEDIKHLINGEIIIADTPQEATKATALITLTPSQKPLIKREWVNPGTIIFPMGSFQEIEDEIIFDADKIIVDHVDQALHRGILKPLYQTGKITPDNIYASLPELSRGLKPLNNIDKEIVVCIPIGTGAMDVAVAAEIYKRAKAQNLGSYFDFLA